MFYKEGVFSHNKEIEFQIAPRVGECITFDEKVDGDIEAQNYRVKAIIHGTESGAETVGDLILEHTGTDTDFRKNLFSSI